MSTDQTVTAPPQLSPDGHWWWDGAAWVPASQAPGATEPIAAEPVLAVAPEAVQPLVTAEPRESVQALEPAHVVDPMDSAFAALAELAADPVPAHAGPATAAWQPASSEVIARLPVQGGAPPLETSTGADAPSQPSAPSAPLDPSPQAWSPLDFGAEYSPGPAAPDRPASGDGRGLGIASLVLSVLYLFGFGSLLAVVLGHVSRGRDRRAGVAPNGLALAGLVLGYVGLALIPLLAAVVIPTFLAQRAEAATSVVTGELRRAVLAQEAWAVQNGGYTQSMAELGSTGYITDAQVSVQVIGADRGEFCLRGNSLASGSVVLYADSTTGSITTSPCT